jgi:acyl-homoserine-lactone acylase
LDNKINGATPANTARKRRRYRPKAWSVFHVLAISLLFLLSACAPPSPPTATPTSTAALNTISAHETEILWDEWGVPHIYGKDTKSMFYAFGWAQMHSHGDLILKLYGQARGRTAEYWGEELLPSDLASQAKGIPVRSYLESERSVHTHGIPDRAHEWYVAQTPQFRHYLDAFAAGINDYAGTHPERIADAVEVVLPVDGVDVIAHTHRVLHYEFILGSGYLGGVPSQAVIEQWLKQPQAASAVGGKLSAGSNAWAIAPSRTSGGRAMLLQNPHLLWGDFNLFYEAQLTTPGYDAYGASLVGFPVLTYSFNDDLGWALTVNVFDGVDHYELTLVDGGYRWEGNVRAFETEAVTLKVQQPDGTLREEPLRIERSIHGPVVARKGDKALALRVVGLDAPRALEQWWAMSRAHNLGEFEAALRRLQLPFLSVIYADRDGHIIHLFNGLLPKRSQGDFAYWQGVVPGDTSATLWTEYHPYNDLPRVVDPASGWLHNSNEPPWMTTFPYALNPEDYPPYTTLPPMTTMRSERSGRMLIEDSSMSFDELVSHKHSTRLELADRVLGDLLPAAREQGGIASQAANLLAAWDRKADADSLGALLFMAWFQEITKGQADLPRLMSIFAVPWDLADPYSTPRGLKDPQAAAAALEAAASQFMSTCGTLEVPYGEVQRLRLGGLDLPGNGGAGDPWGIFRVTYFFPAADGKFQAVAGDTYVAAIEFSDPVRAKALLSYGNATQPGSPHVGDQLELYARKELRPVWRTRAEIEANLEFREAVNEPTQPQ